MRPPARRTRTWRTRTWRAGAWRARSWSGTAAVTIAATRRRTGHIADAALQIAEVGGLQLKHLRAKLFDAAAAVAQRIGVHFDATRVERAATVVGILGGLQAQLALGTERAGIGDATAGIDAQVLLRMHCADVLQPAIGGDHQLASLCTDLAGIAHADAMLVADQPDAVGVHATERAHVQCEGRLACSWLAQMPALTCRERVMMSG
ncbi:hypothetical protein G6F40_013913 [Rhizopus arrhizus]|nr:hypothetical protein G6F40_013913 [Rhizopus arrhizus]